MPTPEDEAARERQDRQLDEALEETFPASDPIALSGIARPGLS
ncbi:MAG: hypothetical protein WDN49_26240 [Acetobacteraceae bacterium]